MDLTTHLMRLRGATTTALALADGFTDRDLAVAVRRRRLERVRRGAFIATTPLAAGGPRRTTPDADEDGEGFTPEERFALGSVAVARARGEHLSHASAIAAHGLPLLGASWKFELARPGQGVPECNTRDLVVRRTAAPLHPSAGWPDVRAVPIGVAVAQLATTGRRMMALAAADAALHESLIVVPDLVVGIEQAGVTRGRRHAEWVVAAADRRAESPGESVLRILLAELGVVVTPQVDVYDQQGRIGRVDFLDEANRVVYEFDGAKKYRSKRDLVEEKRREDRLRRAGYRIVRFMWQDLTPQRALALVARRSAA